MASLVKEIADENNQEGIRQMACIVCKNLVYQHQSVSTLLAATREAHLFSAFNRTPATRICG